MRKEKKSSREKLHSLEHGVGVIAVHNGRVLLMHRDKDSTFIPDKWDFLGGGIESGETAEYAARRELQEESGIEVAGDVTFLGAVSSGIQAGKPYFLAVLSAHESEVLEWKGEGQEIRFLNTDEVKTLHMQGQLAGPLQYVFMDKNEPAFFEMINSGKTPSKPFVGLDWKE